MHFGFALDSSNIDLLDTRLDLLDADIPNKQFFLSPRRLQDMYSRRLQDMSSIRL